MRKSLGVMLAVSVVAVIAAMATKPAALEPWNESPQLPADLDRYLAQSESRAHKKYGLIPQTEKRVRWQTGLAGSRTPFSVVYFHGFSATRQEIAPVGEMIADALGANLFETRLAGHGRESEQLRNISAEDWLRDAAEALAVGSVIGERIIVMGTSTGGTVALAMLEHPLMKQVEAMILMSPNLVLRDTSSEILTWPGGPPLAKLLIGETRSWSASNELQERFWTTTYPLPAVVEMMRLVKFARENLPGRVSSRLLTIVSPSDAVVNPQESRKYLEQIVAPSNEYIQFELSADDGQHVLAGDILSPASNKPLASIVVNFVNNGSQDEIAALPSTNATALSD